VTLGLYLHIPFCASRCHYCDFVTWAGKDHLIPAYLKALVREIEGFRGKGLVAKTIFFGGGTPSLFSADGIDRILTGVRAIAIHFAERIWRSPQRACGGSRGRTGRCRCSRRSGSDSNESSRLQGTASRHACT